MTDDGNSPSKAGDGALRAQFVSDALVLYAMFGTDRGIRADLRGAVQYINRRGGVIFVQLRDTTGTIQLIAERDNNYDLWNCAKHLKSGDRVIATGLLIRSKNETISVSLDAISHSTAAEDAGTSWHRVTRFGRVARQLFLARVRTSAWGLYSRMGFLEIDTSLLITNWHSQGIEPLRVLHAGFGPPTFLTTSAHSQLLEATDVLDHDRLFTFGRCFSNSFLDSNSSMEAPVLSAIARDIRTPEAALVLLRETTEGIIRHSGLPEPQCDSLLEGDWAFTPVSHLGSPSARDVERRTCQTIDAPISPTSAGELSHVGELDVGVSFLTRVVWPPKVVLAEAAGRTYRGNTNALLSISVYLERFMPLFHDVSVRDLVSVES